MTIFDLMFFVSSALFLIQVARYFRYRKKEQEEDNQALVKPGKARTQS